MKTSTVLINLIILTAAPIVFGQQISEKLCEQVFNKADQTLRPKKTYRREIYTSDCDYEYDGKKGASLYITLKRFRNDDEAKREVQSKAEDNIDAELLYSRGIKTGKNLVQGGKFWDSFIVYEPAFASTSAVYLLRKKNYVIVVLSHQPKLMEKLAESLIEVDFDQL